jgi:molybdopterin-synthase adenylyltransferase
MNRYEKQMGFIGEKAQQQLFKKSISIVGLGALGSVAAELCARAGIGKLTIIDHDIVEVSNLPRQNYTEKNINTPKADALFEKLAKINSNTIIIKKPTHFNNTNCDLLDTDVVLDCTDNLKTRFLINEYCTKNNIPWVHGAAAGPIGVVLPFSNGAGIDNENSDANNKNKKSDNNYCFNCVFSHAKSALTCDDAGIINTASTTTAAIQVTEAIKILLNKPTNNLIRFNIWNNSFDNIMVKKDESCAVCNGNYNILEKGDTIQNENNSLIDYTLAKCKTRAAYSAKPKRNMKLNLGKVKKSFEIVLDTPIVVVIKEQNVEIIVHNHGELIFKNSDNQELMNQLARKIYEAAA